MQTEGRVVLRKSRRIERKSIKREKKQIKHRRDDRKREIEKKRKEEGGGTSCEVVARGRLEAFVEEDGGLR